ncbi:MAG TPA: pyridoxal-phosphate dependent enzyme, partial [Clostridiales bacterium]|nr:pyridoxal-phosphate dependent enzyme [Clostridiales bacterium]
MLTLDRVYLAGRVLKDVVKKTDLIYAPAIAPDCEVYLKTENLQRTGSFKVRGSYFKMSAMTDKEKEKGVVACSAGNHAQGVALAAKSFGIKATIFLPATAPLSKIESTRQYGAQIELVDGVYDDAYLAALKFRDNTDALFVHP